MGYVEKRQKQEEVLLKELAKIPIVGTACRRAGISRATYYRWREESRDFEDRADLALSKGQDLINDVAESHIVRNIHMGDVSAGKYWLSRHHYRYMKKPEAPLPFRRPVERWSFIKQFWP